LRNSLILILVRSDEFEPPTQERIFFANRPTNGSDSLETPNIDKIGKEGLVFDQGYLNAALSVGTSSAIEYVTLREDAYSIQTCTYSGS
jgi:hypothetical protein